MGYNIQNNKGMSLIEVMIVAGVMAISMAAMMSMFQQQAKSFNFLEFQGKREQLRATLMGQFLNNSDNCKCLFSGADSFPETGTQRLTGNLPTQISSYNFTTPGDCATATPAYTFVDSEGVDSLKLVDANIVGITPVGSEYQGTLLVNIENTKESAGSKILSVRIPVGVETTATGSNRRVEGCSVAESLTTEPKVIICRRTASDPLPCNGRVYNFQFSAADCTDGILPDDRYVGMQNYVMICGGEYGTGVLNAGELSPSLPTEHCGAKLDGPGYYAFAVSPCSWPSGDSNRAEVVYVRK